MRIIGSSCRRRGISTILGVIIFVGIMFTSVIPMFLVMNQADTLHEIRKHDMKLLDEGHFREDISFYPYALTNDSDILNISITNKCGATVKIIRIWINNENYTLNENIQSMQTRVLENFIVELINQTSYTVKVVTEKGNSFSSVAGTLHHSEGGWYTPSLGICVHIENIQGKYQIGAKIAIEAEEFYQYNMTNIEHEDIEKMIWVDSPGSYYLTIKKWDGGDYVLDVDPVCNDFLIEIDYPITKPITDVYVSGIFS